MSLQCGAVRLQRGDAIEADDAGQIAHSRGLTGVEVCLPKLQTDTRANGVQYTPFSQERIIACSCSRRCWRTFEMRRV